MLDTIYLYLIGVLLYLLVTPYHHKVYLAKKYLTTKYFSILPYSTKNPILLPIWKSIFY